MRCALGVAALLVLLAGCGRTADRTTARVVLGAGTIAPDSASEGGRLLDQTWLVSAPVRAVDPDCSSFDISGSSEGTFNGSSDGAFETNSVAVYGGRLEARASPGVELHVRLHARCVAGKHRGAITDATRNYSFPTLSCVGGLVRVLALRGTGTYSDDSASGNPHPLRVGTLLRPYSTYVTLHGGKVKVGAPECNGFVATLSGKSADIGGYDAYGRGRVFSGDSVALTGDKHAGPIVLHVAGRRSVWVSTRDGLCAKCLQPAPPSTVQVVTHGRRSVIRVDDGGAVVHGLRKPLWLGSNQEVRLVCSPGGCTASPPHLVQPYEPLQILAPRRRALAKTLSAARPPNALLAPVGATADVKSILRSASEPAELVVTWSREHRPEPGYAPERQFGAIIWVRRGNVWRREYQYGGGSGDPEARFVDVAADIGDVTGDGHADAIIVLETGGSGGCADYHVLASIRRHLREVLVRKGCREWVTAGDGDALTRQNIGPCPDPHGSVHCFGGIQIDRLRWNGKGFSRVNSTVTCNEPQLDPKRSCRARS